MTFIICGLLEAYKQLAHVLKPSVLSQNEVPVMLVTVWYPLSGNWVQKPRRSMDEVLEMR